MSDYSAEVIYVKCITLTIKLFKPTTVSFYKFKKGIRYLRTFDRYLSDRLFKLQS